MELRFDLFPPDWTSFLDPAAFLALQCAQRGDWKVEDYWRDLCKAQLRRLQGHLVRFRCSKVSKLVLDGR